LYVLSPILNSYPSSKPYIYIIYIYIYIYIYILLCIIGYTETCTIYGDVCVLSAVGTAAVVKYLGYPTVLLNTTQVIIYIYIHIHMYKYLGYSTVFLKTTQVNTFVIFIPFYSCLSKAESICFIYAYKGLIL
jgi:hypothetical protein